jgi:hypothetical protein
MWFNRIQLLLPLLQGPHPKGQLATLAETFSKLLWPVKAPVLFKL